MESCAANPEVVNGIFFKALQNLKCYMRYAVIIIRKHIVKQNLLSTTNYLIKFQ